MDTDPPSSVSEIAPATEIAANVLEHRCLLDFEAPLQSHCSTAIICTLGPSCNTPEMVEKMLEAGMTLVRINMSYGSHAYYADLIKMVRQCVRDYSQRVGYDVRVAVAIDTKGPEIRTGKMDCYGASHVPLVQDAEIVLTIIKEYAEKGSASMIYVDYPHIVNVLKPGDAIFLDDGYIRLTALEVNYDTIKCVVTVPGVLRGYQNVIIKGADIDLPFLSERDFADLKFAQANEVNCILVSYMKDPAELVKIRNHLRHGGSHILLMSKIETIFGLKNFDAILAESDGIVISRVALSMELDGIQVLMAQKKMLAKCRRAMKPCYVATQLVVSMINNPKPHRREVFDISNSVMDGASGLLLSSATATGSYPVECLEVMITCARQVHAIFWPRSMFSDMAGNMLKPADGHTSTIVSIMTTAINSAAKAIILVSANAVLAKELAAYRPHCPVVVVVQSTTTARQCNFYGGLYAFPYKDGSESEWMYDSDDDRMAAGLRYVRKRQFAENGQPVVLVTEVQAGSNCSMRILNF